MLIKLNECPTTWNTISILPDRHAKMEAMFSRLAFKNVTKFTGEIIRPYTIGVAKGHLEVLLKGTPPFIVMEDDCLETIHFTNEVEVENNWDALYLGTSTYGMFRGQTNVSGAISSNYNEKYLRIYNMLSMHAILYLNRDYVNKVAQLLSEFISDPVGGCDDPIAKAMKYSNVMACKKPMFFQADGHSEQATLTPLTPLF